ncbi:MAG: hypothetical protein ACI3YI_04695, partial [Bacteroidaceae bacterium]
LFANFYWRKGVVREKKYRNFASTLTNNCQSVNLIYTTELTLLIIIYVKFFLFLISKRCFIGKQVCVVRHIPVFLWINAKCRQ